MRRLLGNTLRDLVDEAVDEHRVALLAAQPRVLLEAKFFQQYRIDLRGGKSAEFMNKSVLPDQLKKTLRNR